MSQKSYRTEKNKLYLIPTPIGNLDDITYRAVKTLNEVDLLLCEDTRVTAELLHHLNIRKTLISCHEHNETKIKDLVLKHLHDGKNIGLVTDRGTPIISDPGYKITEAVIDEGYDVISLPGATALIPALTMSGVNPSPFVFYGFLNSKKQKAEQELEQFQRSKYTIILYESPHRILDTLTSIRKVLGNRRIAVCRELTKLYEEVYRGTVDAVLEEIKDGIKGEIVIIIEGNTEVENYDMLTIVEHVNLYIEDGLTQKDAIKKVAKERNIPKSIVYKEFHIGE